MTLLERLRALVDHIVQRIDYYAARSAKVVAQNGDGSFELKLDDPRFPDLARVPARFGLPGCRVKVAPGARCLVTFENGDPDHPVIVSWDAASALELVLGDQDGRAVARQGDMVTLTMPPAIPVAGTMTVAGTPTPFLGMMTLPTVLSGIILTGSGRVKAAG